MSIPWTEPGLFLKWPWLSLDYESVYFVDIETDRYAEYSSRGGYRQLQLDYSGNEFWGDVQKN